MSEKTDYSEFKKSELENWIELSHAFLDNQGVPRKDGGTLSIYGRIERYSVIKSQELAALRSELDALREALRWYAEARWGWTGDDESIVCEWPDWEKDPAGFHFKTGGEVASAALAGNE